MCVCEADITKRVVDDFVLLCRGRGMPRMGPMGGPPRNFNGPPNMRGRGILRGIPPRGMGFR